MQVVCEDHKSSSHHTLQFTRGNNFISNCSLNGSSLSVEKFPLWSSDVSREQEEGRKDEKERGDVKDAICFIFAAGAHATVKCTQVTKCNV